MRLSPPAAAPALSLAATFHPSVKSGTGSDEVSSGTVQLALRPAVDARTRTTSAGVTTPPRLPKLVRTYNATDAIHSSSFAPIGIMTSV